MTGGQILVGWHPIDRNSNGSYADYYTLTYGLDGYNHTVARLTLQQAMRWYVLEGEITEVLAVYPEHQISALTARHVEASMRQMLNKTGDDNL